MKKTFTFNSDGQLVPKRRQRSRDEEFEELERYVTNRSTHSWDDCTDGECGPVREIVEEEEGFGLGTFRIRANDALAAFDKALYFHYDRARLRRLFEEQLTEHIDGWRGDRALQGLTQRSK